MTILRSEKVILRSWKEDDKESLAKHADNRNVSINMRDRFPSPYTLKDAEEWIALARNQSPLVSFAIEVIDEAQGRAVGGAGLMIGTDVSRLSAEVGYWLGESHWGKGIATEALKLITEYGFETCKLVRICAGVFEGNTASTRVLEKAGYTFESRMRKSVVKDGKILDQLNYVAIR